MVFFLTDEPDKTPDSAQDMADTLLGTKTNCAEECFFVSGLIDECVPDVNQKLFQFMKLFALDGEEPLWGDISQPNQYADLVGAVMAGAVAEACSYVPVG